MLTLCKIDIILCIKVFDIFLLNLYQYNLNLKIMSKHSEMSRDELWQQDYDFYMNTGELSEFFEDEDDYEYDDDDYSNPKNNKQSQEVARCNLQGIIVAIVLISIMVYALWDAIS